MNGVQDLAQPSAVAVSPDGKQIYATSAADAAVTGFDRNASTGRLTFIGAQRNGQGGVQGLGGALALVLSPDGANLYAAGNSDASVAVFARNAATGQLTFVQVQTNNVNNVVGLAGPTSLAVSPDGKYLYVTGRSGNALVVFRRDSSSGALTFVEALVNGVGGIDWLKGAIGVVVSPDGTDVYVAGRDLGTLAMLRRDTASGSLTFNGQLAQGVDGVVGLARPVALAVPPSGAQVYVASFDQDIGVFNRATVTGLLSFAQNFNGLTGGPTALTVSPDGARLYVTSFIGSSPSELNVFTRAADGTVAFKETYADGVENAQGLNGASAVAVSPDSRHVYVAAGRPDNSLAVFANTDLLPPTPTPTMTTTFTHPTPTPSATPVQTTVASPPPTPTPSSSPPLTPTPSASPPPAQTATASPTLTPVACTGDCGLDGEVTVNELLIMVNIALGTADVSACTPGDADGDGEITINEILKAVNNTLAGC